MMKQKLIRISLCLLIGMVINFGVAILLIKTDGFGRPGTYKSLKLLDAKLIAAWSKFAPDPFPLEPDELYLAGGYWGCQGFSLLVDDETTELQIVTRGMHGIWAGWPFFSLEGYNYSEIFFEPDYLIANSRVDYYVPGFIRITIPWITRGKSTPVVYPFRPNWLGAMLNSVFYGVLVLIFGLFISRARLTLQLREMRLKQCCPQCQYDLRGKLESGCSECGWNRES